jgi:hypothetical protein
MLRAFLVALAFAGAAHASKPVKKTATGCVVKGTFYAVDAGTAYRFAVVDLDLAPFEGKTIKMVGWLSPGDRFALADNARIEVVAKTCAAAMTRPIKRVEVMDLRLAAGRAADAKQYEKAVELANQAIALVTPADCDAYVDRATVLTQKGDLDPARADLALVRTRKCHLAKHATLNWLLLQDLATAFVAAGDKKSAVTALELARAACTTELCKPDIEKALEAAKQP